MNNIFPAFLVKFFFSSVAAVANVPFNYTMLTLIMNLVIYLGSLFAEWLANESLRLDLTLLHYRFSHGNVTETTLLRIIHSLRRHCFLVDYYNHITYLF